VWDWPAGHNFVLRMSDAIDACDRMVALWSAPYLDRDRMLLELWKRLTRGPVVVQALSSTRTASPAATGWCGGSTPNSPS